MVARLGAAGMGDICGDRAARLDQQAAIGILRDAPARDLAAP
jgi:hypothetical protein